jgi:glyoxylate reductase/D-3-phosphoglycerate dehydrogenase
VPPSADAGAIARELAPSGFELTLVSHTAAEFEAAVAAMDYMVCYPNVPMPDAFYRAAPRLKLVQLLSAGYDNVDLQAARRAKVPVCNNGGANAISVAEHSLMLMLAVARKVIWQHGNVAGGRWRGNGPAPRLMSFMARRWALSASAPSARRRHGWRRHSACGCNITTSGA